MLDRKMWLSRKVSQDATPHPTARKVSIERETAVDQPQREINILTEIPQNEPRKSEDFRIIGRILKRSASKACAFATIGFRIICQAASVKHVMAMACKGKGWTIMRIFFNGPPE